MPGESNGTKVLLQLSDGQGGFNSIIGQLDFTASYDGSPIDVSSKSDTDFIALMDGELSGKAFALSGSIIFNDDASYQALRALRITGSKADFRLVYLSNSDDDAVMTASVTSLSDSLSLGDKIVSSIEISADGYPDIASGGLDISTTAPGALILSDSGYTVSAPDDSQNLGYRNILAVKSLVRDTYWEYKIQIASRFIAFGVSAKEGYLTSGAGSYPGNSGSSAGYNDAGLSIQNINDGIIGDSFFKNLFVADGTVLSLKYTHSTKVVEISNDGITWTNIVTIPDSKVYFACISLTSQAPYPVCTAGFTLSRLLRPVPPGYSTYDNDHTGS